MCGHPLVVFNNHQVTMPTAQMCFIPVFVGFCTDFLTFGLFEISANGNLSGDTGLFLRLVGWCRHRSIPEASWLLKISKTEH